MTAKKRTTITMGLVLLVGTMLAAATMASAEPGALISGNPSCQDLGYDFGYKPQPEPPPSGGYTFPDGFNTVTITSDGTYFDWQSTLGIDAVIVKGGPNANVYVYDPLEESFGDSGLSAPLNKTTPYGISHIEFCYDYELDVSKDANTTFTRTFGWTIEKSVTPETLDMFTGDSGSVEHTVELTKGDPVDSEWEVSGTIITENNTPFAATITSVSDVISSYGAVAVDCGETFPYALAADGSLECDYSTALPNGDSRTNTANVTTTGDVGGGSAVAAVLFGNPTTVVNDSVNVDDTFAGDLGSFSDSRSVSYSRTFTCDRDEGTKGNTATIVETGQSSSASVTVNCYALTVTKDADTSLTRTWTWTIDKSANQTDLLLSDGQLFTVNYEVTVAATSNDSDWAVEGGISVYNPAPIEATLNAVSDVVSPNIAATVDCGESFPYVLEAGETLYCTYSADLPDAATRTNTATAVLQNTPDGTTDFTGTALVDFAGAKVTEVDECIEVSDTNVGIPGTVCASDAPQTFEYSLWFGAHPDADVVLECGDNTHVNVASFVTNDTGGTDTDDHTVNATVPCDFGCTLTQGYWKTHSSYGPAHADDAWFALGDADGDGVSEGPDEQFFASGKTYYQVLWTSPAGNAYYNLAHQYIAAELNIANGTSTTTAVDAAMAGAEALFAAQGSGDTTLTRAERNAAIGYATTLDNYNNGLIGPGHCSE